ncbi:hypothetical protein Tco_0444775 [Tanacetum coccineum]
MAIPTSVVLQKLKTLSTQEKLRYDSDIKAVNILLLGLPVDIYTFINHYQTAKEIWDRVKKLMEGTKMTKQERESMLYDEFDKFTSNPEESIHSYYLRYAKLIIDMKMILMSMSNLKIITKFVNHLQPEWSRFVTIAKQARDLHSVNFDQLYAFLKHNEKDAKEVREMRQQFLEHLLCWQIPTTHLLHTAVSKYSIIINHLNHIAKQCTTKKRVKDSEWFKDKMLLAQAQEARVVLNDEQQHFLADSLEETDDCEDLKLQATTNFKADHV